MHGENSFTICEYTARREQITIAVKELVLRGLITVEESYNGFCYKINLLGEKVVKQFQTNFSEEYAVAIRQTAPFCFDKDERQLIKYINDKATSKIGGTR